MKKYILKMIKENEVLSFKLEQARLTCIKQRAELEKQIKQLDIETAIKKAKDGISDR